MATSGSTSVAVTKYDTLKFSWWIVSQSVTDNSSTVGWKMELIATSYGRISSTANKAWSVTVNGVSASGTNKVGISNNATKTLASGTCVIMHNEDGTKNFSYSFSQEFSITFSGVFIGTKSGSGSGTLDTIARKSSVSVATSNKLGETDTFTVTKYVDDFSHALSYRCGSQSGTISPKTDDLNLSWTVPIDVATENPTGQSVVVEYVLTTYNGDEPIGSTVTPVTYAIPENLKPVVYYTKSDPNGHYEKYGVFVHGHSKLQVDVSAYSSYGAWIKSYNIEFAGLSYPAETAVTEVLSTYGEQELVITVTDSRDRTTVSKSTVIIEAYEYPKLTALTASRCNSTGGADASGAYLRIGFSTEIVSLNDGNSAVFDVKYKKLSESRYTAISMDEYDNQYLIVDGFVVVPAETSASYEIIFSVRDDFNGVTRAVVGPSVKKVMSFLKKAGKIVGAAIGKVAELEDVFDIAHQTRFDGGILHPVLQTNSDLDNEMTPKTYMLLSKNTYINAPENKIGAFFEIIGIKDTSLVQRFSVFSVDNPRVYERTNFSGSWSAWVCVRGDFVVEQGKVDGWYYRKWNSGIAECEKSLTHKTSIASAWGVVYCGTATARQNYPFPFVEKPVEIATVTSASASVWIFPSSNGDGVNGTYASACYNVARPSAMDASQTFYINIKVTGKWK